LERCGRYAPDRSWNEVARNRVLEEGDRGGRDPKTGRSAIEGEEEGGGGGAEEEEEESVV
jgi:hypothetical protein